MVMGVHSPTQTPGATPSIAPAPEHPVGSIPSFVGVPPIKNSLPWSECFLCGDTGQHRRIVDEDLQRRIPLCEPCLNEVRDFHRP